MDDKMGKKVESSASRLQLHPRLRSMLNIRTGPSAVLAELHPSVRIPRHAIPDEELDLLYPRARTQRDPRVSLEDAATVVSPDELATLGKDRPPPPPEVQQKRGTARAGILGEGQKALDRSPAMTKRVKGEKVTERPMSEFSVFVQLDGVLEGGDSRTGGTAAQAFAALEEMCGPEATMPHRRDLVSMTADAAAVEAMAGIPGVASVEVGEGVRKLLVASAGSAPRPESAHRRYGRHRQRHRYGAEVIVGVIDVEGFDFAHEDFERDGGGTRFLSIWDQAADPATGGRDAPSAKPDLAHSTDYGSEITRAHMDAAIEAEQQLGIPATTLEPQSSMVPGSHGTHVASIMAGNRGVCRNADIVGVTLALADGDHDRRRSFYDTTRLAHAVDYILAVAEHEGRPVTINISLGTNGHSHDRSAAISRWIDYAVATPGRAVTVAAGNAGQTDPDPAGGIGHLLGRIHASGHIDARELREEIRWQVFGNGLVDISTNEMEIWYPAQDLFALQLTAPDGEVFGPIEPGHELVNFPRDDHTRVSIHNDRYHPVNGFNRISVYLTPFFATDNDGTTAVVGVQGGSWTAQLIGREIRDGRWHAWIERDDPVVIDDAGPVIAFFPSAFDADSFDPSTQISTLACGDWVNAVANLDAAHHIVNASSSRGPTRTGDPKPDICAPGTDIVAANGFSGGWVEMSGTSMASPFVAGVVGLMLGIDRMLTAAQISSILRRTAAPLPGYTFQWDDGAGFGQIDPDRALEETESFRRSRG